MHRPSASVHSLFFHSAMSAKLSKEFAPGRHAELPVDAGNLVRDRPTGPTPFMRNRRDPFPVQQSCSHVMLGGTENRQRRRCRCLARDREITTTPYVVEQFERHGLEPRERGGVCDPESSSPAHAVSSTKRRTSSIPCREPRCCAVARSMSVEKRVRAYPSSRRGR
jgi:hypothetical protein